MDPLGILITKETDDAAGGTHNMLGLGALVAEMAEQGIGAEALLLGTGLLPQQLDDPQARITQQQKLTIFRNTKRLSAVPDVGLRAGARQRLSDFGVYGYAVVSSRTFGDAVMLGIKHVRLAGPVLEKRFRLDGDTAVFEAHDRLDLGDVLPLATEFWFASILKLATCVLEAPMPSRRLLLPYARPDHAAAYERMFGCPVNFGADVMEWHFDADVLRVPCPNANPITAGICAQFCERMFDKLPVETDLSRSIRTACLNSRGEFPNAEAMAARLGLSVRTLHRRLADEGQHYQRIIDDVRRSLAIEFLENTSLTVDEIAGRVGFSEASNFRKAFRKWTGHAPAHFRA
ncbi:MAG: AraC family transcriptional regulator [Burkholderiaceae bacterium]|nr:AraC family transcriptional regulator [Burkholderiaceae bacterium]